MPTYTVNRVGGTIQTIDVATVASDIKSAFALGAVNNTSDLGKPVSGALTSALAPFVNISAVGEALNNPPVLEFNFKEDQHITKNLDVASGTLINGKVGPPAEFTRASGATYKDHFGNLLYAPENLTLYSYTFENAYWDNSAYVTEADGTATDPFGVANNATTITQVTDASARSRHVHELNGPYTPVIGQTYCMSVYIKQHETTPARYFQLAFWSGGFGATAFKNFDIQDKTVSTIDGGSSIISSGIETLPNGWMRIFITAAATTATASGFQLAFVSSLSAVRTETSIVSSAPLAAYIHGAQVERSTAPRKYLSTTSSIVYGPRFHYDSINQTSLGLIFEQQKTNYAHVNSGTINVSNTTVTTNYSVVAAPDGSYTSTRVVVASGVIGDSVINLLTYDAVADGQYTRSFFVKALSAAAKIFIRADFPTGFNIMFDLITKNFSTITNDGTYALSFNREDYGNGWIRVYISALKNATHELNGQILIDSYGASQKDILFWGPQLEDGPVMTSYIPNSATQSLVRSPDTCAITGANFSKFYNAAAGTLCVDYRSIQFGSRTNNILSVNDGTANNQILIRTNGGESNNSIASTLFNITTASTSQYTGTSSNTSGTLRKAAFSYSNTTAASLIIGTVISPSINLSVKTLPIVDRMTIGSDADVMNISALRYYRHLLSTATLQITSL
jgi:hypothetical protein